MRRLVSIAALGAVGLLSFSAQAQRGMGGRGGGGGVSMGGRGGGVSMGGRSAGPVMGARGGGPAMGGRGVAGRGFVAPARVGPAFASGRGVGVRSPGRAVVVRNGSRSGRVIVAGGFRGNRFRPFGFGRRNRFFFNNNPFLFGGGFGFGFGYPYSYIPGFDNGYYGAQQEQQPVVESDSGNNNNDIQLAVEMQRLSDQVESMREEQRQANAARASGASLSAREPAETTTFIFRDGQRIFTANYAIAGQTLWVLGEHSTRKMSLADLDVAATEQANAANGVDLHIPGPPSR